MTEPFGPHNLLGALSSDDVWQVLLAGDNETASDGCPPVDVGFGCALLGLLTSIEREVIHAFGSIDLRPEYLKACVDDEYRLGTAREVSEAEMRAVRAWLARTRGFASSQLAVRCELDGCGREVGRREWPQHLWERHDDLCTTDVPGRPCAWSGCGAVPDEIVCHVAAHFGDLEATVPDRRDSLRSAVPCEGQPPDAIPAPDFDLAQWWASLIGVPHGESM